MANKLVGTKAIFGVEFAVMESRGPLDYGSCALWLGGDQIQDLGSKVFLQSVASSLIGLVKAQPCAFVPEVPSTPEEFLLMMEEGIGLPNVGDHYFLHIEGFDDFLKLFFKKEHSTTFFWGVDPRIAKLGEYAGMPSHVSSIDVPNAVIREVVEQFERALRKA